MLQNSITLTGRVFDVNLKNVGEDSKVANANISFKTGKEEEYSNILLVFWNKTAERAERLLTADKGVNVIVDGRVQQNKWKNEDGETRSRVQIIVNSFVVLDDSNFQSADGKSKYKKSSKSKKSYSKPKSKPKSQPKPQPKNDDNDDDLFEGEPF